MYLDVLDGHDGAGEVHVRVHLDNDRVHSVWENVLEVLTKEKTCLSACTAGKRIMEKLRVEKQNKTVGVRLYRINEFE